MPENIGRHGKTQPYKSYTSKYFNITDTKFRNISKSNRTQGTIEQNLREAKDTKYRNSHIHVWMSLHGSMPIPWKGHGHTLKVSSKGSWGHHGHCSPPLWMNLSGNEILGQANLEK